MSSSSSKPSSPSKANPSNVNPEVAAEIARLMRDPNALRSERSPDVAAEIARLMRTPGALRDEAEQMRRSSGRGHYDPNQPRVPAGDPKGGQFASKGYRSGDSGGDARVTQASLDATQLAQLGQGNPRDAFAQVRPFDGILGEISAAQHLASQNGFIRAYNNAPDRAFESEDKRYRFVTTLPAPPPERTPAGARWIVSSTTYAHDTATGAYATISATPTRLMIITSAYGKLLIRPFSWEFDRR